MRKILLIAMVIIALEIMAETRVLFIGDSITDGKWGSPVGYPCPTERRDQNDKNHLLGHGFVEMTAGYYCGEYPEKGFQFLNRGISGETLGMIASRWTDDVIAQKPHVVSLLCGTNDVHYWLEKKADNQALSFDYEGFAAELDSLVAITCEQLPGVRIILCTPFVAESGWVGRSPDFPQRKETVDSLASIVRAVAGANASTGVELVDFNRLLEECDFPDIEYWIWDGIHPTTAFHYLMSKRWRETVDL